MFYYYFYTSGICLNDVYKLLVKTNMIYFNSYYVMWSLKI